MTLLADLPAEGQQESLQGDGQASIEEPSSSWLSRRQDELEQDVHSSPSSVQVRVRHDTIH